MSRTKIPDKVEYTTLAIQIKWLLNDVIEHAFRKISTDQDLLQFKRFKILCTDAERRSFHGDCHFNKENRTSTIRIVNLGKQRYQDCLITAIHEVSHHIEYSLHETSGHGNEFYRIHKKLLFAAFDMDIIQKEDVVNTESYAQNSEKLARMMKEYRPSPVKYKQDQVQIFVYHGYECKENLKVRGYCWNKLDESWSRSLPKKDLEEEQDYLEELGVPADNIRLAEGGTVITRLKKTARVYNVPFERNAVLKKLGFRWNKKINPRCWQKQIDGEMLPPEEYQKLKQIPGIDIKIH